MLADHEEELPQLDVRLYPNPAIEEVNVEMNIEQNGTFELFDLLGNRVAMYELQAGENRLKVSTAGLGAGVYLYKTTAGDKCVVDKLIIIR